MNTAVHFSSAGSEWSTPEDVFVDLDREFGFTLDAAASRTNAKSRRYFSLADDALRQTWTGVVWLNPPYGRAIGHWLRKAFLSSVAGATVVCLVPARTDTRWWHDYCLRGEVRYVRGRLRFGQAANPAPFPSAVVIFRGLPKAPDQPKESTNCN